MTLRLRTLCLLLGVLAVLIAAVPAHAAHPVPLRQRLAALEKDAHGRLGVACIESTGSLRFGYRDQERFPFCSTFKFLVAAAVLQQTRTDPGLLAEHIRYGRDDLLAYAPVTRRNLWQGMTVGELCAAALQVSDNTAANLLIRELGGTRAVNAFARSIGDPAFRLDRTEPNLNTAIPDDPRDTTTPLAMARDMRRIVLGNVLSPDARAQLVTWIQGNTTGAKDIRAGIPAGWVGGDKTGSGGFGTTNDIAVLWPPQGNPLILALYFTQQDRNAQPRHDVLAKATRLVLGLVGENASGGQGETF
jgi:beta-lactamase class A